MNLREDFENSLKKWIRLDTQIRMANQQLRDLRNEQDKLSTAVCDFMRTNNIEKRKIETQDSKIEYYEKKSYSSLSYAFLEKYLADIIPNTERVIEYLKDKREIKYSNELKRTFHKGMKRGTAKVRDTGGYESE